MIPKNPIARETFLVLDTLKMLWDESISVAKEEGKTEEQAIEFARYIMNCFMADLKKEGAK